jgi:hypothetical protein
MIDICDGSGNTELVVGFPRQIHYWSVRTGGARRSVREAPYLR